MKKKPETLLHKILWRTSFSYRAYCNSIKAEKAIDTKLDEIIYGLIYESTTRDSKWLAKGISPGRWAVGYNFMYVLYRVLNETNPESILELGAGQTTKLIMDYKKYQKNTKHITIEQDDSWKAQLQKMFEDDLEFIKVLPLKVVDFKGAKVNRYDYFKETLEKEQFDLILIDGPWGSQGYERIDILDILPNCLTSSFIIIIDDCQSDAAKATMKLLQEKLYNSGIDHRTGVYHGETDVKIITSKDKAFFCSL